jgi:hypothetical protein
MSNALGRRVRRIQQLIEEHAAVLSRETVEQPLSPELLAVVERAERISARAVELVKAGVIGWTIDAVEGVVRYRDGREEKIA